MKVSDLNRFQHWLIKIGRMKVIVDESSHADIHQRDIYMCRYFLWRNRTHKKKSNLFLHKICRSDADRHLHDHPWDWATFLIWGNYKEITRNKETLKSELPFPAEYPEISKVYSAPSFRIGKAYKYHRLVLDKPVWSLFWHGPHKQSWGFKVGNTKVLEEDYNVNDYL